MLNKNKNSNMLLLAIVWWRPAVTCGGGTNLGGFGG